MSVWFLIIIMWGSSGNDDIKVVQMPNSTSCYDVAIKVRGMSRDYPSNVKVDTSCVEVRPR